MSLCSNCRIRPAVVRVGSCVLCGRCSERAIHARRWTSRNIRSLPGTAHSLAHRMFRLFVREQADRLRRRDISDPAGVAPEIRGIVEGGKESFFARMRVGMRNLPHLFRGFFQPGRA